MNVYLYSGKDLYRMEAALKDFLKRNEIDRDHTITIDASDKKNFRFDLAMSECDRYSLFDNDCSKAVILKNPFFLNGAVKETEKVLKTDSNTIKQRKETELKNKEQRFQILESYLKHPNPDTFLIFYCYGFDADTRKKDYKLLQQYKCTEVSFKLMKDKEFDVYVTNELKHAGFKLSTDAFQELKQRISLDTFALHNAIEKMDLYGKKSLDLNDIKHIVPMNSEIESYVISNLFIKKDLAGVMKAKEEMNINGIDAMGILTRIASRLRTFYFMKLLYEDGLDDDTIAMRMHANMWAVKFTLKDLSNLSSKEILYMLKQLADLDQNIKAGFIDPKEGLDTFLIQNGKNEYAIH